MTKKTSHSNVDKDADRDQSWKKLQVGELRYHQLFHEMVDGFALHEIICDQKGAPVDYRFLEINPAFERLTGLKAEDLIGRTVLEVMPDTEPEWIKNYGRVALTGEAIQFENYSQELERYYSVKAYCPEPEKFATIFSDITERKRVEKRIQESEEKYRSLFENVPDGVYRTTPDGQFLAVNPTFLSMFGISSDDEMVDFNAFDLYVDQGDRQAFIDQLEKNGKVQNMEVRVKRIDGEQFIALDNCHAVRDDQGDIQYYEGTITDITERKNVEKKLEIHRMELERLYRASSSLLLTPSNDLESLAKSITETVFKEFDHSNCSILLVEEGFTVLRHIASVGEFIDQVANKVLDLDGPGLISQAIRTGQIVNAPNVLSEKSYIPNWDEARSEMVVPLKVEEQVIGVIDVQSAEPNAFSTDDERLITVFAERAAMALERTKLFEAEQRRVSRLDALQNLATELASLRSERDVLSAIVMGGASMANSPTCAVMLLDDNEEEAVLAAQSGLQGVSPGSLHFPLELPIIKESLQNREPIIIADIDRDAPAFRKLLIHPDINAFYAFPLILGGRVVGYITLSSLRPRLLSEGEATTYELLAKLAAASLENVRLLEQTQRNLKRLASLRVADVAIASSFNLTVTLDVLLEQVITQLQVDAVGILIHEPSEHTLKFLRGAGFRTQALKHTKLRFGEGFAGRAALERRMIKAYDLQYEAHELNRSTFISNEGFVAYWGIPLLAKGVVKGVLEVFSRKPMLPDQEWLDFLEVLAGQAAIAIDNAELYNNLQRSNTELFLAYDNTLEGWANALELRDKETEGHARRVTDLTTRLAEKMGVRDDDMIFVRWGALLHDIGKMGIPDDILLKPGALTEEEWVIMRRHPEYAFKMLSSISYLERALDIPYCHHEKWDGTGYPRKLEGDDIPLTARIFAVIDVWDALNSDRPYREAWPREKALGFIREQAGSHFDPIVVDAFLELIAGDDGYFL